VAALATIACSRTYDVKPEAQQEIGFGTWAETMTKARTAGADSFTNGDTFNVYGYNTNGSGTVIFTGDEVSTTNGTTWTYSPLRFWDPTASFYFFYAISPSGVSLAATPVATDLAKSGLFASGDITFSGADNDILVANQKKVAKASYSSDPVALVFNHITSKVDFFVKKDATLGSSGANATVKITSAQLVDVSSVGSFTVKNYTDEKPVLDATYGWTPKGTKASYPSSAYTTETEVPAATTYSGVTAGTTTGTVANLFGENAYFVLMPQDLSSATQKLSIAYTITTGTAPNQATTAYTASIPLMSFVNADKTDNDADKIQSWAPGKHYKYTLTIGANAINFSATITSWGDAVTGYHYLLQ